MHRTEKAMKPLQIGDPAPDFVVDDATGRTLHELIESTHIPALLYFYPADFSPACTAQACMVRNVVRREGSGNGIIIGVSPQRGGLHRAFRDVLQLPQQLVSDHDRAIGKSYGAAGRLGLYRRLSFIIGVDKHIAMKASGSLILTEHRNLARKYYEAVRG